jgi:hypothetical protein
MAMSAGKVISEPPPATALTVPAARPAAKQQQRVGEIHSEPRLVRPAVRHGA